MNSIDMPNDHIVVSQQLNNIEDWRQYILNNPSGTIYHLPEWNEILENSLNYKPYHLFARDSRGKICGVLPLFLINSIITGKRLVSLPFSYLCNPLADSELILLSLLTEAKQLCDDLHCHYLEIKTLADNPQNSVYLKNGFNIDEQFSTYILELSQPEFVWKKLDPKSVRWAIGKARKDGVTVRKASSISDINIFYRLNLKTKRRIGVPGHPENLFLNMFNKMGNYSTLYLAEYQSKVIAGIITQKFNKTVVYGYGASDDEYRKHQPNDLLVWTAIEESCIDGFKFFDFGRTSPGERSVTSFKKHWGTEERKLAYYYYPKVPDSLALNSDGLKYKIASGLWKKLPLNVAQICSNKVFRHLG